MLKNVYIILGEQKHPSWELYREVMVLYEFLKHLKTIALVRILLFKDGGTLSFIVY